MISAALLVAENSRLDGFFPYFAGEGSRRPVSHFLCRLRGEP